MQHTHCTLRRHLIQRIIFLRHVQHNRVWVHYIGQLKQLSHYRPEQVHRAAGLWSSRISRQLAHGCAKVFITTHQSPLPPPTGDIPGTHFCQRLTWTPWPQRDWKDYVTENPNDHIKNGTHILLPFCVVTQPTVPLCTPFDNQPTH